LIKQLDQDKEKRQKFALESFKTFVSTRMSQGVDKQIFKSILLFVFELE